MRVAIVENTKITHHGQVGVALHEVAALVDVYRPFRDGVLPEVGSFDALISFGGEQSALDDHLHPYLPRLGALMAESSAAGVAVLGICLGAQVFARGLGAQNHLGTAQEFGWCAITLQPAARLDPVLGTLPDQFDSFQWHSDTFTLATESVHLATSPVAGVQCFRHGRAGYGMQFHFEASCAVARDWARTFPALSEKMHPGWAQVLPQRERTQGAQADAHGLALARAWVKLI